MTAQTMVTVYARPSAPQAPRFPACPSWCDKTCAGDVEQAAEYGITHMKFFRGTTHDDAVTLEQHDTVDENGIWVRGRATINVTRDRHPEEFSLRGLSATQAWALADLIRSERLADGLLEAIATLHEAKS